MTNCNKITIFLDLNQKIAHPLHTEFSGIFRYMLAKRFQQHSFTRHHNGIDPPIFNIWREGLFGSKKWSKLTLKDLKPTNSDTS